MKLTVEVEGAAKAAEVLDSVTAAVGRLQEALDRLDAAHSGKLSIAIVGSIAKVEFEPSAIN